MRLLLAIALLLPMTCSAGAVFKCKGANGATVFSEKPCGADAQEVKLRADPVQAATTPESAAQAREAEASTVARNTIGIQARKCRDAANYSVTSVSNSRIAGYRQRIAALEARIATRANNLAGATWESGMRQEIAALQQSISTEQASADQLLSAEIARCDQEEQRQLQKFEEKPQ